MLLGKVASISILLLFPALLVQTLEITLEKNGYSGILVGISECVNETDYPNLVEDIQVRYNYKCDEDIEYSLNLPLCLSIRPIAIAFYTSTLSHNVTLKTIHSHMRIYCNM